MANSPPFNCSIGFHLIVAYKFINLKLKIRKIFDLDLDLEIEIYRTGSPTLVVNYAGPKIGLRNYVRITSNWT